MLPLALILIAGFLISLVLTPIVRTTAIRLGIVDQPDARRKLHGRIVARSGGTAVLGSVLLLSGAALFRFDLLDLNAAQITPFLGLLSAMVLIWLIGLADDIWTLRGRQKLLGQLLVALMLAACGFQISNTSFFGIPIHLGVLSIPVSVVWLLATTNALNLIDGSDGLCSTLGAIICGSLGLLAWVNGHFAESAIAFAMCGALLGFLVFNFPPASIFLGDSGSLLVGMVTGALAIRCALHGATTVAFLAPLAILTLPLLDSSMAIVRRKLTGRSIYTTDRAHLHHALKGKGLSDKGLLLAVTVLALITAMGALAGQMLDQEWLALVGISVVIGLLVLTKAFCYSELALVVRRGSHFALSFMERVDTAGKVARQKAVRLQGTRQWETVWDTLVEFAEREQLAKLHLDLNVPWLEEGYHGTWQKSRLPDRTDRWCSVLPLMSGEQVAGRVEVIGDATLGESLESIVRLAGLVEDLTPQVHAILASGAEPVPATDVVPELSAASESNAPVAVG
ncbi:MAG: MraY family glycosyltransferase [Aureliella sp.]